MPVDSDPRLREARGGALAAPLARLEHDHAHLNELVFELRAVLLGSSAEPPPSQREADPAAEREARAEVTAHLELLREDLFQHFAREEEGLFPFIRERHPSLASNVAQIEAVHDAICGALGRVEAMARRESEPLASFRAFAAPLIARFESGYATHAELEGELFRALSERLTAPQLAELADVLEGL